MWPSTYKEGSENNKTDRKGLIEGVGDNLWKRIN